MPAPEEPFNGRAGPFVGPAHQGWTPINTTTTTLTGGAVQEQAVERGDGA